MRKICSRVGLISIILLYSFAAANASAAALWGNAPHFKGSEKEKLSQFVASKSFHHTVQTGNAVTVCSHQHLSVSKDTYKHFLHCNKATGHVLQRRFSQYHFFHNKLLAGLQNPDLIFPFQYFW